MFKVLRGGKKLDNLFLLLFIISLLALFVGIIKPKLVIKWGSQDKRNRKNVLKYYGISLVASFILFVITVPGEESETATTTEKPTEVEKVKLTPEEKAAEEKAKAEKAASDKVAARKQPKKRLLLIK